MAFSENFRQPVTEDLTAIWMNTLQLLSMDSIKMGTRKCLTECEFFPTLSVFIEKSKRDMSRPSTWDEAPKLDYKKKYIKMPEDVKQTVAKLIREAEKIKKSEFVPFRKVYGTENGLDFEMTQDSEGRDLVEFTNRPPTPPTFMNGY